MSDLPTAEQAFSEWLETGPESRYEKQAFIAGYNAALKPAKVEGMKLAAKIINERWVLLDTLGVRTTHAGAIMELVNLEKAILAARLGRKSYEHVQE